MALVTGWRYSEIDQITLWDLRDLQEVYGLMHGAKETKSQQPAADLKSAVMSIGGSVKNKLPDWAKVN